MTKNYHISTLLMQTLANNDYSPQDKTQLQNYINMVNHLISLGEQEHSSDWDPSITVYTIQKEYQTEPGYYDMHISGDNLLLLNAYIDTSHEMQYIIPIKDILSIHIYI